MPSGPDSIRLWLAVILLSPLVLCGPYIVFLLMTGPRENRWHRYLHAKPCNPKSPVDQERGGLVL